jgi:hypothetical protein
MSLDCALCSSPVDQGDSVTDEYGLSAHPECYIRILSETFELLKRSLPAISPKDKSVPY